MAAQYPNSRQWTTVDLVCRGASKDCLARIRSRVRCEGHAHSKNLCQLERARSALAAAVGSLSGECVRPYDNQPMYPELMFQILDSFTNCENGSAIRQTGLLTAEQWRRAFSRRVSARGNWAR